MEKVKDHLGKYFNTANRKGDIEFSGEQVRDHHRIQRTHYTPSDGLEQTSGFGDPTFVVIFLMECYHASRSLYVE